MEKRYQVFISSTFSDLKDERSKVMRTIMSLDCIPAGMELFPAMDEDQFEFIKRVIDDCDYYLLIIGGRYGSVTEEGISYTEKEYDYAIQKGIPVLAFLHSNIDKIEFGKSEYDAKRREQLLEFRAKVSQGRLVMFWNNADDLNGKVAVSLSQTIKQHPAIGWVRANLQTSAESLQEENNLRKELAEKKAYILELEKQLNKKGQLDDIASFDDEVLLHLERSSWSKQMQRYFIDSTNVVISWKELFLRLYPRLMDNPNDERAELIIGEVLREFLSMGPTGTYKLIKTDFDTVKIQFIALGLIVVDYTKTTKGSMALFWRLTPKGQETMIGLRVVRKQ